MITTETIGDGIHAQAKKLRAHEANGVGNVVPHFGGKRLVPRNLSAGPAAGVSTLGLGTQVTREIGAGPIIHKVGKSNSCVGIIKDTLYEEKDTRQSGVTTKSLGCAVAREKGLPVLDDGAGPENGRARLDNKGRELHPYKHLQTAGVETLHQVFRKAKDVGVSSSDMNSGEKYDSFNCGKVILKTNPNFKSLDDTPTAPPQQKKELNESSSTPCLTTMRFAGMRQPLSKVRRMGHFGGDWWHDGSWKPPSNSYKRDTEHLQWDMPPLNTVPPQKITLGDVPVRELSERAESGPVSLIATTGYQGYIPRKDAQTVFGALNSEVRRECYEKRLEHEKLNPAVLPKQVELNQPKIERDTEQPPQGLRSSQAILTQTDMLNSVYMGPNRDYYNNQQWYKMYQPSVVDHDVPPARPHSFKAFKRTEERMKWAKEKRQSNAQEPMVGTAFQQVNRKHHTNKTDFRHVDAPIIRSKSHLGGMRQSINLGYDINGSSAAC